MKIPVYILISESDNSIMLTSFDYNECYKKRESYVRKYNYTIITKYIKLNNLTD